MRLDDEDDPVREAEFNQPNFERVKANVQTALRRSGCILPDGVAEALACAVLEESLSTRRRMSYMVHCFTEHYSDVGYTRDLLERLEAVLLLHQRDGENLGYMPQIED